MHEVSLVHALFDQADRAIAPHRAAAVRQLRVVIGALAGVERELFRTAFEVEKAERGYSAATLEARSPPAGTERGPMTPGAKHSPGASRGSPCAKAALRSGRCAPDSSRRQRSNRIGGGSALLARRAQIMRDKGIRAAIAPSASALIPTPQPAGMERPMHGWTSVTQPLRSSVRFQDMPNLPEGVPSPPALHDRPPGYSIDGFLREHAQPFVAFNPPTARRFYGFLGWLARRLDVQVRGLEHIPPGRALIVANLSFGWDVLFVMAAIFNELDRPVWALGEHLWWKFPYIRRLAAAVGTVDGTPENAARLLGHDEFVLVQPGGLREALKPRELRYRLLWGKRQGFVRAAIASQAPIVPLAAVGSDELFSLLGNAFQRGERWLHRRGIPIPLPSRILPIPHFVPWRFRLGEPIPPRFPAERANDPAALRQLRHEVEGALHELLDVELARRAGIDLPTP